MKSAKMIIWVMAVVVSYFGLPKAGATVFFDDGGTHDITTKIDDEVRVDWEAPGMQTTVNLLEGADVSGLRAYNDSRINMSGGTVYVSELHGYNDSRISMCRGTVENLYAYDYSEVDVCGGSIRSVLYPYGGQLRAYDHSQVTVSGGYIGDDIILWDSSQGHFSNGSVSTKVGAHHESQLTVSGGYIEADLYALENSKIDFSGGSAGNLKVFGRSQVDFCGGFVGIDLLVDSSGILTIYGLDFRVDGQAFGYGELTSIGGGGDPMGPARRLRGTLANGDPLDNDFYIGHDAKIVLAVPEPATLLLLGLGGVMMSRKPRG